VRFHGSSPLSFQHVPVALKQVHAFFFLP
jgi:hypothetical protein